MTAPEKLDYGIIPSKRAQEGLRMLGEDISNYLNGKKENIKTTESKSSGITNIINNYPSGTVSRPGVRFGFVKDLYTVLWMVFTIVGVYIILSHPEWIVSFGDWVRTIF